MAIEYTPEQLRRWNLATAIEGASLTPDQMHAVARVVTDLGMFWDDPTYRNDDGYSASAFRVLGERYTELLATFIEIKTTTRP